jgi:general stress protein 26
LVKKILGNFTFVEKGKQILHTEIISAVLDEIRRERKVKMVLSDDDVEKYVCLDMSELQIQKLDPNVNLDLDI